MHILCGDDSRTIIYHAFKGSRASAQQLSAGALQRSWPTEPPHSLNAWLLRHTCPRGIVGAAGQHSCPAHRLRNRCAAIVGGYAAARAPCSDAASFLGFRDFVLVCGNQCLNACVGVGGCEVVCVRGVGWARRGVNINMPAWRVRLLPLVYGLIGNGAPPGIQQSKAIFGSECIISYTLWG